MASTASPLLVEGFPPSHAGTITVYEDSKPGTLNDFLGALQQKMMFVRRHCIVLKDGGRGGTQR